MVAVSCANASYLARFMVVVSSLFYTLYCFIWIGDMGWTGTWNDEGDDVEFSFICEQSTVADICIDGWESFGDRCYKHFTSPMTFQAAQASCQQNSGNLATIPSVEVNSKILEMCEGAPSNQCRMGLHRPNGTGGKDSWRWIADNSIPAYTNWAATEPGGNSVGLSGEVHGACMFNSGKSPQVYIAGCSVFACIVCSITSAMAIIGTSGAGDRVCKGLCDNKCMIQCGACGDCLCGGCLSLLAVVLLLMLKAGDAALVTLLPAVMMTVASVFGYRLFSQAEEPAAKVSVIGEPVGHHLDE
eukprot:gnl/TRDRNA2_/TRDRNA2_205134_c0_seq1.p1 gnl/TRDRNA2_/TRDRNA2_205134_c0~~gnl/TRDRNA2_/TRDRNA2_205134_c0_seq1.p1  ORF type:complete len:300 (+),score=22.35 gnl/TRDRNA2_/TRDRNA2_205134_c0_seq1:48-947(+)